MDNLYQEHINRVLDYISNNLAGDLSLEKLAEVANFSPFHFHRIFKNCLGETLNQFVNRVRIERAIALLRADKNLRLLDAALDSGYESVEGFSRAFKKRFGIPPGVWNRDNPLNERKIGHADGNFPIYTEAELNTAPYQVEVSQLSEQRLAYIRVVDSYNHWENITDAYEKLMTWYQEQGGNLSTAQVYGMSQDDPDITPMEQCRFDWCVAIPEDWCVGDGISERIFPACKVVQILAQGDLHRLDHVVQYLWRYWLPRSRYQPANLPMMEIYRRLPTDIGWETFDLYSALPVIDL